MKSARASVITCTCRERMVWSWKSTRSSKMTTCEESAKVVCGVREPGQEPNPRGGFVQDQGNLPESMADAAQAHTQADLHGTERWVEPPPEAVLVELKESGANLQG